MVRAKKEFRRRKFIPIKGAAPRFLLKINFFWGGGEEQRWISKKSLTLKKNNLERILSILLKKTFFVFTSTISAERLEHLLHGRILGGRKACFVLIDARLLPAKRTLRQLHRRESQSGYQFHVRKLPRRFRAGSWRYQLFRQSVARMLRVGRKLNRQFIALKLNSRRPRPSTPRGVSVSSFPVQP